MDQQIIPGSVLHGAIRALHETLTGSCLRVFDQEFSPVYRDAAADTDRLRLAVVDKIDDAGRPTRFQLCRVAADPRREKIHHDILHKLGGEHGLVSGARLRVTLGAQDVDEAWEDPEGEWVVFISDGAARSGTSYYAAVRELCEDRSPTLSDQAWQDFLAAVEHTDDLRPANETGSYLATVTWAGAPVGQRYRASKQLRVDQPVWLRLKNTSTGTEVVQLQLAQIWRHRGTTARQRGNRAAGDELPDRARDRVPPEVLACTGEELCPSCRLLGAADTREDGQGRTRHADQQSYRGHLRFSDAVRLRGKTSLRVTLPPLGAPRPGAGQCYLERPDAIGDGDRPALREWGSAADFPQLRRLRGRKFYWHTKGTDGVPPRRGKARPHQLADHPELTTPVAAFPHGVTFTAAVTVVDVDLEQLGSLFATLEPGAVLDREGLAIHLGGGRPLGYGSCDIRIDPASTRLWRSSTRYGACTDLVSADEIQDAALAAFRAAVPAEVRQTWPALAVALTFEPVNVPPDQVWYPPGVAWAHRNGNNGKTFDEGYAFWQQTSGLYHSGGRNGRPRMGFPLAALPEITDNDQSMEIVDHKAEAVRLDRLDRRDR